MEDQSKWNMSLEEDQSANKQPEREGEVCRDFNRGHCPRGKNCPYVHAYTREKTEICRDFNRGECPRGRNCPYLHEFVKTEVCRDYNRGECPRGRSCPYLHRYVPNLKAGQSAELCR